MSCITPDEYIALIEQYIFPTPYEWVFIMFHVTVFVVGLVGNILVCLSVYRNHSMRTVTNYFIVNLAIADFLVILICLPPTVLWDVTETWFLGSALCKIVLYFQGVSVSVSVLTLTFISVDRWYAICYPLKFKSTTGKARIAMIVIWTISLIIVLPDIIVLNTMKNPSLPIDTHYFTDCGYTWSEDNTRIYQLCIVVVLFIAPFMLMSVAYYQIAVVLWNKNIPGSAESECSIEYNISSKSDAVSMSSSLSNKQVNRVQRQSRVVNNTCKQSNARRKKEARKNATLNQNCEGHIRTRRKAAKMLIAVVMMFAFCYFPVHLMNILRYLFIHINTRTHN
ncbi:orexin receptor type 2-like protein, partial [Leptotrombidium deliense]